MERIELDGKPARILTTASDGSIRFVSPVSGGVLSTAFPIIKDCKLKTTLYNKINNLIWTLDLSGQITVYNGATNPMQTKMVWKPQCTFSTIVIRKPNAQSTMKT